MNSPADGGYDDGLIFGLTREEFDDLAERLRNETLSHSEE